MSVKGTNDNFEFYEFYNLFVETEESNETKTDEIENKKEESAKELSLSAVAIIAEEIDVLISEYLPFEDLIEYAQRSKKLFNFIWKKFVKEKGINRINSK
jgi:hypothetical protein